MVQTLGSVAVGTVVKINENGSPVNYLVVHQGLPSSMYDASCNGTWVLRQDIYEKAAWNSNGGNSLATSTIIANMSAMLTLYDAFILDYMHTAKIPYCVGGGSTTIFSGANGLQRKIFPLGGYEVGLTSSDVSYLPADGAKLDYFESGLGSSANNKRTAYLNSSIARWWLRSPYTRNEDSVFLIGEDGEDGNLGSSSSEGIRPALILSNTLYVRADGTLTNLPSPSYITVPANSMVGNSIPISWGTADGADSYILQRNIDGDGWTQVYAGSDLTYTDTAGSWTTVQYQVCGVFDGTNGAFAQSDPISIIPASALVISGSDGDLGTVTSDIPYNVTSNTGNQISLTRTVNGVLVASLTVNSGFSYNIPVMDLPTGTGTIVITATVQTSSDPVTVTRNWTYTKAAQTFQTSGGVASLSYGSQPIFPQTLAEAVKTIGGPWGGNLSSALNKLAMAATYNPPSTPKYSQVDVNLANAQAGDIVNLPVNGVMVPHIVVQAGNPDPSMYDSSCNGVWLLRRDIAENGQWNSTNVNTLAGSTIMTTMQGYVTDYDSTVQAAIQTVKIPYCVGNGSETVNTLEDGLTCKMFPLSGRELGANDSISSVLPNDGVKLSYFDLTNNIPDKKRVANYNGSPARYFTRSIASNNTTGAFFVFEGGNFGSISSVNSYSYGYRPCFLLPTTFSATYYVDTDGNVYPEQEYTTAGDFYDLWGNVIPTVKYSDGNFYNGTNAIPTVKIATGSYTGTGAYGIDNPNTLTFPFEPQFVFISKSSSGQCLGIIPGVSFAVKVNSSISYTCKCSKIENGISWYTTGTTPDTQLNYKSLIYYYIAIG